DLLAIDLDTERCVRFLDVLGRHRPVHLVVVTDGALDLDADLLQLALERLRDREHLGPTRESGLLQGLHAREVPAGRRQGESTRDQVVASIARADPDDVPTDAEIVDVLLEHHADLSSHDLDLSSWW